jgi:hypothetical protein
VIDSGTNRGKPSLVKFQSEETVAASARSRVKDLLERHPLYPGIEL